MDPQIEKIVSANQAYSKQFGAKGKLPMPPGKQVAILTCMDARLDPLRFCGLDVGDAHVVRNGGGRASDDAIRSLVISQKLLGTRLWLVIHHTDCGMETFTNEVMGSLLVKSLETAKFDGKEWVDTGAGPGSIEGNYIDWLPIRNQEESVRSDVSRILSHPLVPADIEVYGFLFDVKSGALIKVDTR